MKVWLSLYTAAGGRAAKRFGMPVRSLNSPVRRWPDKKTVLGRLETWARQIAAQRPEVLRIGVFGSLVRDDWGVGSDLDLIIVVEKADEPFARRGIAWDTTDLPVPVDLMVYTLEEWQGLDPASRFARTVHESALWVYDRHPLPS